MRGLWGTGLAAVALTVSTGAPARTVADPKTAIGQVLDASAAGWNGGDLDRFMACYKPSDAISYVSGSRFVRGFGAIRAMYGERFRAGAAAMGKLRLAILDVAPIDGGHVYVVGRFTLDRDAAAGGAASGLTTLVFERTPAGWRIIADHS